MGNEAEMKKSVKEIVLCKGLNEGQARLRRFSLRVREGRPQNPEDMVALADAFDAILQHADPKKALGISGKRYAGRPAQTGGEWSKGFEAGLEVERLRKKENLSVREALDRLEEKYAKLGISRELLKRYRERNLKTIKGTLDVEERSRRGL
jgi:hypothetical protein